MSELGTDRWNRTVKCDCHGYDISPSFAWDRGGKIYCEAGFAEYAKTIPAPKLTGRPLGWGRGMFIAGAASGVTPNRKIKRR